MPGQYWEFMSFWQDWSIAGVPFWFWYQYFGGSFPLAWRSWIPTILYVIFFDKYIWNKEQMYEILGKEYVDELG